MTTSQLIGAIRKWTAANGRSPTRDELLVALATMLNQQVDSADVDELLDRAISARVIGKDADGGYVVLKYIQKGTNDV